MRPGLVWARPADRAGPRGRRAVGPCYDGGSVLFRLERTLRGSRMHGGDKGEGRRMGVVALVRPLHVVCHAAQSLLSVLLDKSSIRTAANTTITPFSGFSLHTRACFGCCSTKVRFGPQPTWQSLQFPVSASAPGT